MRFRVWDVGLRAGADDVTRAMTACEDVLRTMGGDGVLGTDSLGFWGVGSELGASKSCTPNLGFRAEAVGAKTDSSRQARHHNRKRCLE